MKQKIFELLESKPNLSNQQREGIRDCLRKSKYAKLSYKTDEQILQKVHSNFKSSKHFFIIKKNLFYFLDWSWFGAANSGNFTVGPR